MGRGFSKTTKTSYSGSVAGHNTNQLLNLSHLEAQLRQHWRLGRNIAVCWSRRSGSIAFLAPPYYVIQPLTAGNIPADGSRAVDVVASQGECSTQVYLQTLLSGSRRVSAEGLDELARVFEVEIINITLPYPENRDVPEDRVIDEMVCRYSINYVENRAVILIDIVGFSRLGPFIQAMQLNSLAYSINSAHSKLQTKELNIDFARSTTGDGFYLWNRDSSLQGNMDLYYLLKLVLADNAIAWQVSVGDCTPKLKTAFHIGDCYEFYQVEGLQPTRYNYIVGDVTIELARIVEKAVPGQVLIGDFEITMHRTANNSPGSDIQFNSISFIDRLKGGLANLNGVVLSDEKINTIKCYLTGEKTSSDQFNVSKYSISGKHGTTRYAYNAKINIYREKGPPVFLGLQESEIKGLARSPVTAS